MASYRWENGCGRWVGSQLTHLWLCPWCLCSSPGTAPSAVKRGYQWQPVFGMHVWLFLMSLHLQKRISSTVECAVSFHSSAFVLPHFVLLTVCLWLPMKPVISSRLLSPWHPSTDGLSCMPSGSGYLPLRCFLQLRCLCNHCIWLSNSPTMPLWPGSLASCRVDCHGGYLSGVCTDLGLLPATQLLSPVCHCSGAGLEQLHGRFFFPEFFRLIGWRKKVN